MTDYVCAYGDPYCTSQEYHDFCDGWYHCEPDCCGACPHCGA